MRATLDTNILAYAEGVGDQVRCAAALQLIEKMPGDRILLPAQALGELSRVLTGKAKRRKPLPIALPIASERRFPKWLHLARSDCGQSIRYPTISAARGLADSVKHLKGK